MTLAGDREQKGPLTRRPQASLSSSRPRTWARWAQRPPLRQAALCPLGPGSSGSQGCIQEPRRPPHPCSPPRLGYLGPPRPPPSASLCPTPSSAPGHGAALGAPPGAGGGVSRPDRPRPSHPSRAPWPPFPEPTPSEPPGTRVGGARPAEAGTAGAAAPHASRSLAAQQRAHAAAGGTAGRRWQRRTAGRLGEPGARVSPCKVPCSPCPCSDQNCEAVASRGSHLAFLWRDQEALAWDPGKRGSSPLTPSSNLWT